MAAKDQNCSDKFTQLYLQYYQNMIRYATSIVKSVNIAEELVHDAYIKILKHIEEIEEPSSARTKRYLLVTVRNVCFVYLLKNVPTEDLADYEAVLCNPLDSIWDKFTVKEINEKLVLYLGKLSEKDRRLFIDATIKGYRYKELTERYQMTEGNISVKIFRLRMRLRKMFDLED